MNHIFLGVNPQYIGESPYVPAYRKLQIFEAEELSLTLLSKAQVKILPNISGYVGGDITALILAKNLHKIKEMTLAIDIGTNGEIVLGNRDKLICCSAAAGPAFEGGHISCGMGAIPGAIEKVAFDNGKIFYDVIGDTEPKGICGTGLIDAIAEMLKAGIINHSGRICPPEEIKNDFYSDRLIQNDNEVSFVLVPTSENESKYPIIITQKDIRQLQLSKAAIYAGIKILMNELFIHIKDIDKLLIAGSFGSYINKYNAQLIGMFPNVSTELIEFVGNTAIIGAKQVLLSQNLCDEAQHVINFINYIELSAHKDFQNEFSDAMFFNI